MRKEVPPLYWRYLETRRRSVLDGGGSRSLGLKGFLMGAFLSSFLAIGAPYGNMIIRGSYMALDFSTPGAIFVFLFLIGVVNTILKAAARGPAYALLLAALAALAWGWAYWPFAHLDPYSPGLIFSTFA
ncbi:MAG: hypothetical protein ABIL09_25750, partial [Gemmatimonadota bacterium]